MVTSYGVPRIIADDYQSAGYAYAYLYAKESVCLFAEKIMTVAGERSRYLGAATNVTGTQVSNLNSDFYYRSVFDDAAMDRAQKNVSADSLAVVNGFIRGYNRWLRDAKPADIPEACRGKPWLRPITLRDMQRAYIDLTTGAGTGGLGAFISEVANAQPPAAAPLAMTSRKRKASAANLRLVAQAAREIGHSLDELPVGSNGVAMGSEVTENGKGLLLGNPHWPWAGVNRLNQFHLRVNGKIDVMGTSIGFFPSPMMGFNKDVAWTHTVSTGRRVAFFEL